MGLADLLRPVGGWRTQLIWRAVGAVQLQLFLQYVVHVPDLATLVDLPASLFAFAAVGALLVALGARPILWIAAALSMTLFLHAVATTASMLQLAEELLPLAILPALAALLAPLATRGSVGAAERNRAIDDAQMALFRVSLVVLMSFAVLHKLNADFLDPEVSCASLHFRAFLQRVPALEIVEPLVPFLALVGEVSVPLLLLAAPRIGLPTTVLVMGYVGHRGATTFALFVVVHALAFLRPDDRAGLAAAFRRRWPWLLGVALLVLAASSLVLGGAVRKWIHYSSFELALLAALFGIAHLLWADLSGGRGRPDGAGLLGRGPRLEVSPAVRGVLLVFAIAGVVNGMSPYLGLKDRLSQAMFSNLRADEERWNHLVVPEALQLRSRSPFVRVSGVEVVGAGGRHGRGLADGFYTPSHLRSTIERVRGRKLRFTAEFRGERRSSTDAALDRDLLAWLESLPPGRLFRDALSAEAKQPCIH